MRKFDIDYLPPSATTGEYPGAFPPKVDIVIRQLVRGKVLHLFSGTSLIGDERIDIEHPNATRNMNVKEFIATDVRNWDWIVLDPPYQITRTEVKLNGYGIKGAVSSDVIFRRNLKHYFQKHTENILWLDICAPMIKGFKRQMLWLVLNGDDGEFQCNRLPFFIDFKRDPVDRIERHIAIHNCQRQGIMIPKYLVKPPHLEGE